MSIEVDVGSGQGSPILESDVYAVGVGIRGDRQGVSVLQNFALSVAEGEIFGFLALNGAGKTTGINLAMGFIGLAESAILLLIATWILARRDLAVAVE